MTILHLITLGIFELDASKYLGAHGFGKIHTDNIVFAVVLKDSFQPSLSQTDVSI